LSVRGGTASNRRGEEEEEEKVVVEMGWGGKRNTVRREVGKRGREGESEVEGRDAVGGRSV